MSVCDAIVHVTDEVPRRHFSAFNARHTISAQRTNMHPETVEALALVLEGYKNNII